MRRESIDESKMSKQPPPAPTVSSVGPCPTVIQIVGRPGTILHLQLCNSFPKGLKNEFETAVVNEPSVFEPLKFYCITTKTYRYTHSSYYYVNFMSDLVVYLAYSAHC